MNTDIFMNELVARGYTFFAGVPDSVLSPLSTWLESQSNRCRHIIAANEGNAIGLAMGHYLGTGQPAVVYMQNSGLGNAVNPLTSLAARDVYDIPLLLIIGWRGMPGIKDEPQHKMMGRITCDLLKTLEIPYCIGSEESDPVDLVERLSVDQKSGISALLLPKGSLSKVTAPEPSSVRSTLLRETALRCILERAHPSDCIIATTGKTGRELFELRQQRHEQQKDFLTVGGMGHASSIALGLALAHPERRVICLDGDGSLIMHMGALGIIADQHPNTFIHVLLNNGCHESVGGQPTVAQQLNFEAITKACGYQEYHRASDEDSLQALWKRLEDHRGTIFVEIDLAPGSRSDLGRPTSSPIDNKDAFMRHVRNVDAV